MRTQPQPTAEVLAVLIDALASRGKGGPYRTPAPPPSTPPPRARRSAAIGAIGLVLIAVALVAFRRDERPLAELPAAERAGLLTRTLENLALCERHPGPELRSFCAAQSAIARELPECDDTCRELARARYPSRSASARP
jgi:hypothetical protein